MSEENRYVICVLYEGIFYFLVRKNCFSCNRNYMRIYKSSSVANNARRKLSQIFLFNDNTMSMHDSITSLGSNRTVVMPAPVIGPDEICGDIDPTTCKTCRLDDLLIDMWCPIRAKWGKCLPSEE